MVYLSLKSLRIYFKRRKKFFEAKLKHDVPPPPMADSFIEPYVRNCEPSAQQELISVIGI